MWEKLSIPLGVALKVKRSDKGLSLDPNSLRLSSLLGKLRGVVPKNILKVNLLEITSSRRQLVLEFLSLTL